MRGVTSLNILVVEDDPEVNRSISRFLERLGHKVSPCRNGRDALMFSRTFDCAVMDIDLPDADGIELASELLDRNSIALVVFFSASQDPTVCQRALKLGPFVPKSSGSIELAKAIADLVSRTAQQMAVGAGPVGSGLHTPLPKSGPRRVN